MQNAESLKVNILRTVKFSLRGVRRNHHSGHFEYVTLMGPVGGRARLNLRPVWHRWFESMHLTMKEPGGTVT